MSLLSHLASPLSSLLFSPPTPYLLYHIIFIPNLILIAYETARNIREFAEEHPVVTTLTVATIGSSFFTLSLFTLHSSLFTLHSSLFTPHSSLFTLHSSLFTLHSSLCHSSLFTLHCSLP